MIMNEEEDLRRAKQQMQKLFDTLVKTQERMQGAIDLELRLDYNEAIEVIQFVQNLREKRIEKQDV